MKKFLITLIAVYTMLFSFGVLNASAATSGTCGTNLTWTLDGGTLTISGQENMKNYSNNSNDTSPWYSSKDIVNVIIEDGVTSIGNSAFLGCSSLANITIPDSVTSIGEFAFLYCSSLVNITIPDIVTSIGEHAFNNCINLKSVTIPNSVTDFGDFMFYCCSSLENITLPNSITRIGKHMFQGCSSLANITIPNSVTRIDEWAFYGCDNLTDVYYNSTEEDWRKVIVSDVFNQPFFKATMHYVQDIPEQYHINEITIKDMSGNNLQSIPTGTFLATVSFTNVSSSEDTVIILAQYSEAGTFKGLMYIQTEDVPIGSTIKLSIPVDNSNGDIAKIKAFCWESFGSMTPMGNSTSFSAE